MSRQVIIKVQPNETMFFPGICVNCSTPAADSIVLEKQHDRIIRRVDVPLCEACAGLLRRESGEEERRRKLSWLITASASLIVVVLLFMMLSAFPFWLRLFLALIGGAIFAGSVRSLFQRVIERAALPEKRKIRESARLVSFSRQTATFVFNNDSFAERFVELNQPALVAS